ncbi:type I polyketide synthase [Nocardia sp. NPDC051570]|uniref:type I polyketide synthase n=1 Tax=Nocardia sp. NPDC051570 TaxID=3364324 RepID=UPI0037B40817
MNYQLAESDIAIIGMAARFPGARNIERFWANLASGSDALEILSREDLIRAGVPLSILDDSRYVPAAQRVDGVEMFDADFFGIAPADAEIMDPQHRLFLEVAYEACENSGYVPAELGQRVGVYAGAGMNHYLLTELGGLYRSGSSLDQYRMMIANERDFLATRVSYKLNLRGPSVGVSTACSTSGVAVHTACLALLGEECDAAIAGAVHLRLPANQGYTYTDGMIYSVDGRCRPFDKNASGTVIGSGVGVVVLKRMADAVRDGDWINAVIRGSAINNDGAGKAGFTAPSVAGQVGVIADALAVADCPAASISYVEAHGTATPLGDPIEFEALREAVGARGASGPCAIGSVKSNIGHLDTAAGIAGLIKTVLMLQHRKLVPSLYFSELNSDIADRDGAELFVNTEFQDWKSASGPLRAGVSSFGIGGTNAHLILEEAPARTDRESPERPEIVVISARSMDSLREVSGSLARQLRRSTGELADVAYTLAVGRRQHTFRRALVARTARDAALALALEDEKVLHVGVVDGATALPGVLELGCAGSAPSSYFDALEGAFPAFSGLVDEVVRLLCCDRSRGEVFESDDSTAWFIKEYAVAELWRRQGFGRTSLRGVGPSRVVALSLAGVISPLDALHSIAGDDCGPVEFGESTARVWCGEDFGWLEEGVRPAGPDFETYFRRGAADSINDAESEAFSVQSLPNAISEDHEPLEWIAEQAARAWVAGVEIDWHAFHADRDLRRVPLPPTPFESRRHWVRPDDDEAGAVGAAVFAAATADEQVGRLKSLIDTELGEMVKGDVRSRITRDENLFEAGVESLMLIELVARLGKALDRDVPSSLFVEYPTVNSFGDRLAVILGIREAPEQSEIPRSRRARRRASMPGQ